MAVKSADQAKPTVALAMGDPAGISPELTAKLLALDEVRATASLIVIGDRRVLEDGANDIAGKGVANIGASRNALLLAAKMGREIAAKAGPAPRTSLADARRALRLEAVPKAA